MLQFKSFYHSSFCNLLKFLMTDRQTDTLTDRPITLPLLRMRTRGNNHIPAAYSVHTVIYYYIQWVIITHNNHTPAAYSVHTVI